MRNPHWEEAYAPTLTRHQDGSITIECFPAFLPVSEELLDRADPAYLHRDADSFTIRVANGTARYRIVDQDELCVLGEKVP